MFIKKELIKDKKILFILLCLNFVAFGKRNSAEQFTIMIDPAGDAKNTGRQIDDSLERGITLQFTQKLKENIESKLKNVKVIVTRVSGEKVESLQNANFANRLDVDFYLSVHFYKESAVKSQAYIYTFSYKDDFIEKKPDLYFYQYDMAHLINRDVTKKCADNIKDVFLSGQYAKYSEFCGVFSLPFKPLIAVKAPAVGIEIGLNSRDDWNNYISMFVDIVDKLSKTICE